MKTKKILIFIMLIFISTKGYANNVMGTMGWMEAQQAKAKVYQIDEKIDLLNNEIIEIKKNINKLYEKIEQLLILMGKKGD